MGITKDQFQKGQDPTSEESQIEEILAGPEAMNAEELYSRVRGPPAPNGDMLWKISVYWWEEQRLGSMVREGRIVSKLIDRRAYYSR